MIRNQTTTQQKIQSISMLQITTKEEAIAFLRAISNINIQIASILQRDNFRDLAARNQTPAKTPIEQAIEKVVEEQEAPVPVEEEDHTEDQKKERVAKLKKALKK